MNQNLPPNLSDFLRWIKRVWALIAGFIGAVTLIGQFIEIWKGSQTIYAWITAILGLLVLLSALLWVAFSQISSTNRLILPENKKIFHPQYPSLYKLARLCLLILLISTITAGYFLYQKSQRSVQKVVVLVTRFDGVDPQKYRVTETVWENLNTALQSYNDVELILLEGTSIKSFDEAKAEGKKHNATIIIWGWYGATDESVRISAHFDILQQPQMVPESFKSQKAIKDSGVTEFQNFLLQDQLSEEMTYLSLATVGFVRYSLQDWDGAISSFNRALTYTNDDKDIQIIQYYIDLTYNTQVTMLQPDKVAVFTISENISPGDKITESILSTMIISRNHLVEVMFTLDEKQDLLNNRVAKIPLDKGVVITLSMVSKVNSDVSFSGPQWAALIPPGTTAISISIKGVSQIDNLACHETASDSSPIVYSYTKDEEINIIRQEDDSWLLVNVNNIDKNCWVNSQFVNYSYPYYQLP